MFRRGDVHAAQIALINMVEADESEKMLSCPQCGTTFDRIQKSGRMGCAACYRALSPLTGKILQRLGGIRQYEPTDKQSNETPISLEEERIQKLKSELVQAVQTENYEQAAVLRDEINALTQQKSGGRA